MRLLVDENLPRPSVARIDAAGHDVASVAPGGTDREVLVRAAAEARVVITLDRDFGALVFQEEMPAVPGVILLRVRNTHPEAIGRIVVALLDREEIRWEGYFSVVRGQRLRQRALPVR